MKVKRPRPPELEHRPPMCTLCYEEVTSDGDGWNCEGCSAYWPYNSYGDDGSWDEEDAPQCPGVIQPFLKSGHENIRTNEYRCLLAQGHEGSHRAETFISWKRQP